MIRRKRRSFLLMSCILMCLLFMMAGQSLAQCSMTSSALSDAMQDCDTGDTDCFVSLAGNNPSCVGNIAWYYMLLNNPDNPEAVIKLFSATVPIQYADEVAASVNEAYTVNREQQNAGSSTNDNEYPFGQGYPDNEDPSGEGTPYGQ